MDGHLVAANKNGVYKAAGSGGASGVAARLAAPGEARAQLEAGDLIFFSLPPSAAAALRPVLVALADGGLRLSLACVRVYCRLDSGRKPGTDLVPLHLFLLNDNPGMARDGTKNARRDGGQQPGPGRISWTERASSAIGCAPC